MWVKLVLATLENAGSVEEIREAVDTLPEGLDKVYVLMIGISLYAS